jgi:DNA (cytosine-5)-methyltransferase 1
MRELALFAGAGGGILGGVLLGWRTVCAVEIDPFCRAVLLRRQAEGHLSTFPIWDDIRTFDGHPWRGHVDVISGGFPCQDISSAGRGAGLAGEKSGLWRDMARIIGEVRPRFAFIENSPRLRQKGLREVLGDIAGLGFNAEWGVFGACDVGSPHARKRMWILAHANNSRERDVTLNAEMASAPEVPGIRQGEPAWWPIDLLAGVDDGLAHRMDRTRATGNGQVPAVFALAWRTLRGMIK